MRRAAPGPAGPCGPGRPGAGILVGLALLLVTAPVTAQRARTPDQSRALQDRAVALTSLLVKVPSITGNEGPVGQVLEEYARSRGFHVQRMDLPDGRPNLAISLHPLPRPGFHLVFLNHLDVVPVEGQSWTRSPWSGEVADGDVWGRGSIDNKGSLAIAMGAMEEIREMAIASPVNVTVLAVAGEETTGDGADHVATHFLSVLSPSVMIGEGGTGVLGALPGHESTPVFGVAASEKSSLWLKLKLKVDSSGHGSVPRDESAILAMVRALNSLSRQPFAVRYTSETLGMLSGMARLEDWPRNFFLRNPTWPIIARMVRRVLLSNPLLAAMIQDTANITEIQSDPGPPNVIPEQASATLDCRLLPGTQEQSFLAELRKRLNEPRMQIEVLGRRPNVIGSTQSPYFSPLLDTLEQAFPGTVAAPVVFPATSDSNTFRSRGVAVFGISPVVLDRAHLESIHAANERLPVATINPAVDALVKFIVRAAAIRNQ